MQAGKLPPELLSRLLAGVPADDPRVFVGPRTGEDAALLDFGDRYLAAKTDPVTFATDLIGWYVVHVNANDLAVVGATPRWLMVTLLLPEGVTEGEVQAIFDQILEACGGLGVTLVGGHTEVAYDLPRPVAVGSMLGEVAKDRAVLTAGARPGDTILLTEGIAIEGAAILAREAGDELRKAGVGADVVEDATELLFSPGISVVRDATVARDAAAVHAMHDPTEGGLATGLREIATAAGVGVSVDAASIPVLPACRQLCDALGLDPLGLIASGALLATVAPEDVAAVTDALDREGVPVFDIGRITPPDQGLKLVTDGSSRDLPSFDRDELARFFADGPKSRPGEA